MDIISHGLWGGVVFGRKNKRAFWWSFGIGIMPDLFSFGILSMARILGVSSGPDWGRGLPDAHLIPIYVYSLYNITHSLIVFALVFCLVWLICHKPFMPLLAWGLHIFVDIPTHSAAFFPTPFLFPLSNYTVNGINWGQLIIFFPDVILLAICYGLWWREKKSGKNK